MAADRTLVAERVSFAYDTSVLIDVSLQVAPGECVVLLGANGAGKTTLLRLLAGLAEPTSGSVLLDGVPPHGLGVGDRARSIGYLPQRVPQAPGFAVHELVLMGLYSLLPASGWETRREWRAVLGALRRVGAGKLARRPFEELSGGEQRRVLLARALVAAPAFAMLDEPLAALDPGFSALMTRQLVQLRDDGVGMVLSTHRLSLARAIADRVVVLSHGRVLATGSVQDTVRPEVLEVAYDAPGLMADLAPSLR